jgi:enediyne biosynthesis protein E4
VVVNNLDGPPALLRNDGGNRNNWIMIKCVGTRSNRSAIGARVKVTAGGHSQIDEVMSGSSYYSQNDLRLHFGVSKATKVDSLEVAWPSGVKENFKNLPVNQLMVVQESKGIVDTKKFR